MAPTETEPKPPENASDLIRALKCDPLDGVQVALFPESVDGVQMDGEPFRWGVDHMAYGVLGTLGPFGTRLLDIVTDPPSDVRWYKVEAYAKQKGLDLVPVRWAGAICDIPERYFRPGTFLGVRFYTAGPWFWPLEQPLIVAEKDEEEKTLERAAEIIHGG